MQMNGVIVLLIIGTIVHCNPLPILGPELSALTPSFTIPLVPVSDAVPTLATANDQLVYLYYNSSRNLTEFGITILRRNGSGAHEKIAFFGNSDHFLESNWIVPTYISWDTNGNDWVSVVATLGKNGKFTTLMVFKVSNNGTISNVQFPNQGGRDLLSARFLSDGSLVGVSPSSGVPYSFSPGLRTFKLVNDTWTLADDFVTGALIQTTGGYNDDVVEPTHPIFVLTDTHFIATDNNKMFIFIRLANGSWTLESSFKSRYTDQVTSISWNGDDAILTGMALSNRFVLYQKLNNGTWDGSVVVTPLDAGFTNTTQFGMATVTVNKDTFLVLAPRALDSVSDVSGRVLIVQRRESQWYLAGQFLADLPIIYSSFNRYNFVVTDTEVMYAGNSGLYSVPLCVFEPAEYTCHDEISLDKCNFGDFTALLVCNSTRLGCTLATTSGASTPVRRINFEDNVVTIDYTLVPFMAKPVNGSVRISCGSSSAAPPGTTPITLGVPVTSPSSSPYRPSDVTSGSSRLGHLFSILLLIIVIIVRSLY